MATASTTHFASITLFDRIRGAYANYKTAQALRTKYNATYHELNKLTDRDLADLGIPRSNIGAIAFEHVYGK